MPRLSDEGFGLRRRPQILALKKHLPKFNLRNVLIGLVIAFILRNLLKNDYRKEEMKYLRDPAMHAKEIEKAIHMSEDERQKFIHARGNDVEKLKRDVEYLLKELQDLRKKARDPLNSLAGRDADLKMMDNIHLEKRKAKEEQLLKDHPDFVPSPRLPRGRDRDKAGVSATT